MSLQWLHDRVESSHNCCGHVGGGSLGRNGAQGGIRAFSFGSYMFLLFKLQGSWACEATDAFDPGLEFRRNLNHTISPHEGFGGVENPGFCD